MTDRDIIDRLDGMPSVMAQRDAAREIRSLRANIDRLSSAATRAADAQLIAAAPDLFEALDQALDDMGNDGHCVCPAAKEMMKSAIAKARSENG